MKKFIVNIVRTSYSFKDIEVEAENEEQAKEKALEKAGDYEFSEKSADYTAEGITKI